MQHYCMHTSQGRSEPAGVMSYYLHALPLACGHHYCRSPASALSLACCSTVAGTVVSVYTCYVTDQLSQLMYQVIFLQVLGHCYACM